MLCEYCRFVVLYFPQCPGFPVPVAAIAAKLIHYGLDRLCDNVAAKEQRN